MHQRDLVHSGTSEDNLIKSSCLWDVDTCLEVLVCLVRSNVSLQIEGIFIQPYSLLNLSHLPHSLVLSHSHDYSMSRFFPLSLLSFFDLQIQIIPRQSHKIQIFTNDAHITELKLGLDNLRDDEVDSERTLQRWWRCWIWKMETVGCVDMVG